MEQWRIAYGSGIDQQPRLKPIDSAPIQLTPDAKPSLYGFLPVIGLFRFYRPNCKITDIISHTRAERWLIRFLPPFETGSLIRQKIKWIPNDNLHAE